MTSFDDLDFSPAEPDQKSEIATKVRGLETALSSKIPEEIIEAVRTRTSLKELVEESVQLRPKGHDDLVGLCPFHNERTPSFHVHPEAAYYKCFGCGAHGDVIEYARRRHGVSFQEAVNSLASRLGLSVLPDMLRTPGAAPKKRRPIATRAPSQTWVRLQQQMRPGTLAQTIALADLRKLPAFAGLELAHRHGQLFFADVFDDGYEWESWLITDSSRRNAQARRADGKPYDSIRAKAKTIQGCEASWPIGIAEATNCPEIALVEGGPDFLAAWHLIWFMDKIQTIRPVSMLGASQRIHPDALPLFANKVVHIFPHSDENLAGDKAAERWTEQLLSVGAFPRSFRVGDHDVKDLNDLASTATLTDE